LVAPKDGEIIVDVGAGTGTFAVAMKKRAPGSRIIGVDPDRTVLSIAKTKADLAGVQVEWIEAMGDRVSTSLGNNVLTKAVSSLVLHQCMPETKLHILGAIGRCLKPGGFLYIADYGLQRTFSMRVLFRQVQMLDGWDCTTPNARGEIPAFMTQAGFEAVREVRVIPTLTGSISLYVAKKPSD
jgi:ubiquinone/menaquinone biosynthesis C-methylase UbiE